MAITVSAAVVLGAALAALPYWFGSRAETSYERFSQQLSKRSGMSVVNNQYDRGWLHSTARSTMRYPGLPLQLSVTHEITHGPIPIDRILNGQFEFAPIQARIESRVQAILRASTTEAAAAALPPITAETVIALQGEGEIHADVAGTGSTMAGGRGFEWAPMSAAIRFDRDWTKIEIDFRAPRLAVKGAPPAADSVLLSNIEFHSRMNEGVAGYLFGDTTLAVRELSISPIIAATGLRLTANTSPAGKNVDMKFGYRVEELAVAGERYGPGQLVVEARRLDAATLKKFDDKLNEIYTKNLPEEQATLLVMGRMLELVADLSKTAPELEITRLTLKVRQDEISGRGKLTLDGQKMDLKENPMLLLTALRGEAELTIPMATLKSLFAPAIQRDILNMTQGGALSPDDVSRLDAQAMSKIIDEALPLYVARNDFTRLLVPDAGDYKISAVFRRGQLLINNEPWRGASVKLP
jgi:uncharacterized protein YdgA (DUF945 family)